MKHTGVERSKQSKSAAVIRCVVFVLLLMMSVAYYTRWHSTLLHTNRPYTMLSTQQPVRQAHIMLALLARHLRVRPFHKALPLVALTASVACGFVLPTEAAVTIGHPAVQITLRSSITLTAASGSAPCAITLTG
jgi:hypothetical protein